MNDLHGATKIVMLFAAAMFLWALLLGTLKYVQIVRSREHRAHPYTDIAHRAALLYSFALLLISAFVQFGQWGFSLSLAAGSALAAYISPWPSPATRGTGCERTPRTNSEGRRAASGPSWGA
jgi:hypothetical protein